MADAIIRYPQLLRTYGIGYSSRHLSRLERDGLFPRRLKLNPNAGTRGACGWWRSEIEAYLQHLGAPMASVVVECIGSAALT